MPKRKLLKANIIRNRLAGILLVAVLFLISGGDLWAQGKRTGLKRKPLPARKTVSEPGSPQGSVPPVQVIVPPSVSQEPIPPAPARIEPAAKSLPAPSVIEKKSAADELAKNSVRVQWFGHHFVYLTTRNGIRIAIDPFGEQSVGYPFPSGLVADVVLITNEGIASSGWEQLNGSPQTFRSVMGVGRNRGNGMLLKGTETFGDLQRGALRGVNCVFSFEVDGVRFGHLGSLGHPLTRRQMERIGKVDVLFLPVGNTDIPVYELRRASKELGARWIVPIGYQTKENARFARRPIGDYLPGIKRLKREGDNDFFVNKDSLPASHTVILLHLK